MSATSSIGILHTLSLPIQNKTSGAVLATVSVRLEKGTGDLTASVSITVGENSTSLENVNLPLLATDAAAFSAALTDALALITARQEAAAAVTGEEQE